MESGQVPRLYVALSCLFDLHVSRACVLFTQLAAEQRPLLRRLRFCFVRLQPCTSDGAMLALLLVALPISLTLTILTLIAAVSADFKGQLSASVTEQPWNRFVTLRLAFAGRTQSRRMRCRL
jgi:hypothetical protein